MMYRLTVKAISICVLLVSFIYAASAETNCEADLAKGIDISEKLNKTPLWTSDSYCEYMREDKALNLAYRTLSKSLENNNRVLLKKAQRQWIAWRDEKCQAVQEKTIFCGTLGCDGRQHDSCIVKITSDRTRDLNQFIKHKDEAEKKKFDFSRTNKSLDDN